MNTKLTKIMFAAIALLLVTVAVQADSLRLKKNGGQPYLVQAADDGTEVWGFFVTLDEEKGITIGANNQYPGSSWLSGQGLSFYPLELDHEVVIMDSMKEYTGSTDIFAIKTNLGDTENWRRNRLGSLIIPDTVVEIGDRSFINCANLSSVAGLSRNMKYIGVSAFEGTAIANDIIFNPTDCVISTNAFLGLKSSSLTIGGTGNVLLLNAIKGATNLTSLNLSGVVRMEYEATTTESVEEYQGMSYEFLPWSTDAGQTAPYGRVLFTTPEEGRENEFLTFEYKADAPGTIKFWINRKVSPGLTWVSANLEVSESELNKWKTFTMNVQNTCASNSNIVGDFYVQMETAAEVATTLEIRDISFVAPYVEGAAGVVDDGILVMDEEWFERYSYNIAGGQGGTITTNEDNKYAATVTLNAHDNTSIPNFQWRFNKVPKVEKLRTLIFDIKTSVELPLMFQIPKDYNWTGQSVLYKVVPAADDWQTVYVDLTGTHAANGELYNQIYIFHQSEDESVVEYPEVSFEIANPRFEYVRGEEYKLEGDILIRPGAGGVTNGGIYNGAGGTITVFRQEGTEGGVVGLFEGNEMLQSVSLGFNDIPANAFKDCINLTTLSLSDTVEKVGANAFQNTAITGGITLNAIRELDAAAFAGTGITSVKLGPNLASIGGSEEGGAFQNCAALTTVEFADNSVGAAVGQNAFKNCSSLVELLNAPFTSIDRSAFYGSGITNIVITTDLDIIKRKAFFGADNLSTVYYVGTAPSTIEEGIFYGFDDYAVTNYVNKDYEAAWAPYTDGGKLTFKSTYTDSDSSTGTTQWMVAWYRYRGTIIFIQ